VERYTYRAPGQANSYFYGYTKLLALRNDTEGAIGTKFNQKRFHDFILAQGLLPPDLMRQAVMEDFVPGERSGGNEVERRGESDPPGGSLLNACSFRMSSGHTSFELAKQSCHPERSEA
jgi:hypothetical protein